MPPERFPLEHQDPELAQATPNTALLIVRQWIAERPKNTVLLVAIESFVVGTRAARSADAAAAEITREIIGVVTVMASTLHTVDGSPAVLRSRPASAVKPWATNTRLAAAGLLDITNAYPRHARDATRHALFAACKDGGVLDPFGRWGPQR